MTTADTAHLLPTGIHSKSHRYFLKDKAVHFTVTVFSIRGNQQTEFFNKAEIVDKRANFLTCVVV